jgi:prepilin peptidase dependent protein B
MMIRKKQQGFTLVELMVGLAVGLIVIGGSLAMFLSTLQSSNHTLKMSKLNQDLTAVMQLMVNEVRRAGYTAERSSSPAGLVFDSSDKCFIYSYDERLVRNPPLPLPHPPPTSADIKKKGFRWVGDVLLMKDDPGTCGGITAETSDALTDSNSMIIPDSALVNGVVINGFVINQTIKCIDVDDRPPVEDISPVEKVTAANPSCTKAAPYVTIRDITITITAQSASFASDNIQSTLTESVRIRNDSAT